MSTISVVLLIITATVLVCEAAIIFPQSLCPDTFKYEDASTEGNSWFGVISMTPEKNVTGLNIRITLDKPADLLISWEGNVVTPDNTVYFLYNPLFRLQTGVMFHFRMEVKFDPKKSIPYIKTLHINSRRACPPDQPLSLSAGEKLKPTADESARPDLDITESSDALSERSTTSPEQPATVSSTACGEVDEVTPLITFGGPTQRGQWPWHATLYKTKGGSLGYSCGGTLVSRNKVITAAHCVVTSHGVILEPVHIILFLGKYRLEQYADEYGVQNKQVSDIQVHPEYNTTYFFNDIAVLTLSSDVHYTTYVRPLCLWEPKDTIDDIVGKEGVVAGWGLNENDEYSDELMMAKLPVVATDTCFRSHPSFYSQYASEKSFCAGYRNGTSPCNGDSGGGLVFKRNSTWYLRGIVSVSGLREGLNTCNPDYYVVFTDVAKYTDFIQRNL